MFNEDSLLWVFAQPYGFYLLMVACEAILNEDFEVELAVYAGKQCGKEIHWVDSFGVEDCTMDDVEDLEELAYGLSDCPMLIDKAKQVLKV